MGWVAYLLALGCVAAFFLGRGTANAGAYQRGYEDGIDDACHDLADLQSSGGSRRFGGVSSRAEGRR
jgi:hypothetical protein